MENNFTKEKNRILVVSLTAAFITTFMGSALTVCVPHIGSEYGVGAAQVGYIVTVYLLACGALAIPMGKTADVTDRNIIMKGGLLVFAAGSAGGVAVNSMGLLLLSRLVQAVGAAMVFSTNNAILSEAFEGAERRKVLGMSAGATYLGMAAGPVMGGLLAYYFNWKANFLFAAVVSVVAFFICARGRSGALMKTHAKWDIKGILLYIAGLSGLLYGISTLGEGKVGVVLTAAAVALLFLFARHEKNTDNPLLNVSELAENKPLLRANIAAMINYGSVFAMNYLLSLYLQVAKEMNSSEAGFVLVAMPLTLALVSVICGRFKGGKCNLAVIGALITAVAMGGCYFIDENRTIFYIIAILLAAGAGQGLFAVTNLNTVMGAADRENYGVTSALYSSARSVGNTLAMAVVTVIISIYLGNLPVSETSPILMVEILKKCFFVMTIWCALGIFMARRKKV